MAKEDSLFTSTDRFEVLRRIGAGGMGVVYEVLDKVHRTRLALKVLPKLDPFFLYRFKQEFRLLADLSHPNLVTLYELFSEGENWFFTMQLVNGVSFNRYFDSTTIVRQDTPKAGDDDSTAEDEDSTHMLPDKEAEPGGTATLPGPLPPETTRLVPRRSLRNFPFATLRRCLRDLINGTAALHSAGLVHGDIKPSNVLVTAEGQIVLLDFGLIRELRPRPGFELEKEIAGTLLYMSPEQALGL